MDNTMKVFAMYLPQFHRVKENDEWWGEGFTDWVSAKNAVPLFEGHYQPRVPQGGKYYDLMKKETMEWQASLMHQYGVDGMCIYHYWFKDGRKILERPAENLLKWKDIDMPFCFCWANETWAYSWSNVKTKNVWMYKGGKTDFVGENGILLKQEYGSSEEWKEHLEYLVSFFRDSRYIKIDNKPLFLIYKPAEIECLIEMLKVWRKEIINYGFDGIYIVGSFCNAMAGKVVDAELCIEPPGGMRPIYENYEKDGIYRFQYKDVWDNILKEGALSAKTYFGGFVGFDDTPRRGDEGIVIDNATPRLFGEYLSKLMAKNAAYGSDIVFINAWNEWGEGMYLEPDERYGTGFLEAVLHAKAIFPALINQFVGKKRNEYITFLREGKEKFGHYLELMDKWMSLMETGENVDSRLKRLGVSSVLIYGFGILGRHLVTALYESDVKVVGIIDKKKNRLNMKCSIYLPTDDLPTCDAVIITAEYYLYEIKEVLSGKKLRLLTMSELLNG